MRMLHLQLLRAGEVDVAAIPASFSKQQVPGMRLEKVKTVDNRGIVFPYVKSGDCDRRWFTNW